MVQSIFTDMHRINPFAVVGQGLPGPSGAPGEAGKPGDQVSVYSAKSTNEPVTWDLLHLWVCRC